ncbi:UNVERIFIED_CONTAM: hypothetical protein GTU68_035270 [Idotea baltica]|nr:hypothetical protein [Idotea baltica]
MLFSTLGFDFRAEENEKLRGANRKKSLEMILDLAGFEFSPSEKELLCEKKNEIYLGLIKNIGRDDTIAGFIPFLEKTKSAGFKIGMGSSSRNAIRTIERLELTHFFDTKIDANSVSQSKPDPTIYLNVSAHLDIQPENCLVFEDAENGILAAKRAGMKVIGIGKNEQVEKADLIFANFEGLLPETIVAALKESTED